MHYFLSGLAFPIIAGLLESKTWNNRVAVLATLATTTTTTTTAPEIPVFKANIKDVPGLHSGLTGVVYLYGVGNHNAANEEEPGGPTKTMVYYAGYTAGLGDCSGENGCTIMVSPKSVCIHSMSRAPDYFVLAWENEIFYKEDFSGMVELSAISELEGKTVIIRKDGQRVGCGVIHAVPDSQLVWGESTMTQSALDSNPEITAAQVIGQNTSRRRNNDKFCFVFTAVTNPSSSPGLAACHSVNDCGLTVIPGISCEDTTSTVTSDDSLLRPFTGYVSLDEAGEISRLVYTSCVATNGMNLVGSSIVLHSSNGIQLACGTIQQQ